MIDGQGGGGCYFLARHELPVGLGVPPLVMHASLSCCCCCCIRLKFRALEYACKPKSAFGAASEEKSEFCIAVAVITVHLSNCCKIIVLSPLHKNRVRGIRNRQLGTPGLPGIGELPFKEGTKEKKNYCITNQKTLLKYTLPTTADP